MKALCVDDEISILRILVKTLEKSGFQTCIAERGHAAIEKFGTENPDIVFLDIMLPELSGIELLEIFKKQNPDVVVVMLTANPSADNALQSLKLGAFDFLSKPFNIGLVKKILEQVKDKIHSEKENRKLLQELQKNNKMLQELITVKRDFIPLLIHDMHQPVETLVWNLEQFSKKEPGSIPDIAARNIKRGLLKAQQLQSILANLSASFAFESHSLTLNKGTFSLAEVIIDVLEQTGPEAGVLGVPVRFEPSMDDDRIWADKEKVGIILKHLIRNALHFTESGKAVAISIETKFDGKPPIKYIAAVIKDQGIGIARDDIQKIFQKYHKIKKKSPHGIRGSGIGLAMVKELIAAHEGKILVSSKEGKGSVFKVCFLHSSQVSDGLSEHTANRELPRQSE